MRIAQQALSVQASSVVSMNTNAVHPSELHAWLERLGAGSSATSDADRIDRIRALEELKSAASAAQAREMVSFAGSQTHSQAAAGVRARDRGRGIATQIGLALRESPHRAARLLGTATALVEDLPETLAALSRGETPHRRAEIVARETGILCSPDRRVVDADLGPRLGELGDRMVEAEARSLTYALDPEAAVSRAARAATERRVTCRPAPDTMTYLTGLLPVRDGVAVYAALDAAARAAHAAGDSRSRGQVMADTLVERVTGAAAGAAPVTIQLIMTDSALLGGGREPARVHGYGPVPADIARRWILSMLGEREDVDDEDVDDEGAARRRRRRRHDRGKIWLRRLFTSPDGKHLVAMDSRARLFTGLLRDLVEYRDQCCTTPFCGAPIRHIDHTTRASDGGATSYRDGRGTCVACNLAREAPGWRVSVADLTITPPTESPPARVRPSQGPGPAPKCGRTVTVSTPTGHAYVSRPPPVTTGVA